MNYKKSFCHKLLGLFTNYLAQKVLGPGRIGQSVTCPTANQFDPGPAPYFRGY